MVEITGTVRIGGTPLEGAKITAINDTVGEVEATTLTLADGTYSVQVSDGAVAHILMEYDDGTVQYNDESKPFIATPSTDPVLLGSESFELRYDGPGIDFTPFMSPGYETQGVTYSPETDRWYVAEVTDTTTPSTIYEYTEDGTATGGTFQFSSSSANHANALQWHDGYLWCSEYNTNSVYQIDWATDTIVADFTLGAGVVDPDRLGAIEFIPTSDGSYKLLAAMWGASNNAAYLVNYQDALVDGTAAGNIYLSLTDTVDTGRFQGLHYHDGALYINHDCSPNGAPPAPTGWGSYPTLKVSFPWADNLTEGEPFVKGRYLWEWLNEPVPYTDPIQDIGLNPTTGTFWIASETTGTVYAGQETDAVNTLPDSWNDWSTAEFPGPDDAWQRSMYIDNSVASGKRDQHIFWQRQPADVEVWLYDDLTGIVDANAKRIYVSTAEPENAHNTTEHAIAINTTQSTSQYVSWNNTDKWHSTGVARPSSAQWVKFRWLMDGSQTTTYISKDGGDTWETGGTYGYNATALGVLIPQVSTGVPSHLGPFKITPL